MLPCYNEILKEKK